MADAIARLLERVRAERVQMRRTARSEAERLFAPATVCARISDALEQLVARSAK
jgi:hypothetical protein